MSSQTRSRLPRPPRPTHPHEDGPRESRCRRCCVNLCCCRGLCCQVLKICGLALNALAVALAIYCGVLSPGVDLPWVQVDLVVPGSFKPWVEKPDRIGLRSQWTPQILDLTAFVPRKFHRQIPLGSFDKAAALISAINGNPDVMLLLSDVQRNATLFQFGTTLLFALGSFLLLAQASTLFLPSSHSAPTALSARGRGDAEGGEEGEEVEGGREGRVCHAKRSRRIVRVIAVPPAVGCWTATDTGSTAETWLRSAGLIGHNGDSYELITHTLTHPPPHTLTHSLRNTPLIPSSSAVENNTLIIIQDECDSISTNLSSLESESAADQLCRKSAHNKWQTFNNLISVSLALCGVASLASGVIFAVTLGTDSRVLLPALMKNLKILCLTHGLRSCRIEHAVGPGAVAYMAAGAWLVLYNFSVPLFASCTQRLPPSHGSRSKISRSKKDRSKNAESRERATEGRMRTAIASADSQLRTPVDRPAFVASALERLLSDNDDEDDDIGNQGVDTEGIDRDNEHDGCSGGRGNGG